MTGLNVTGQPTVLLFYHGLERYALEGGLGHSYSQARRAARFTYRTLRRRQVRTGFYTAFLALERCLRLAGCDVRVNDFRAARANPNHPIGVAGYPDVLARVADLPNPRIFGPGDYGDPESCKPVADDPRWKVLIQPCDWFVDFYRPVCGDKMMRWFAGIDTNKFLDASTHKKAIDVLVYDKIRWDRKFLEPNLLQEIVKYIENKGLSIKVIRYGHHHLKTFIADLKVSRSLLFLCEHETQGLAYQEAMALNVPVLAWDEGRLIDPHLARFASPDLRVSSVPYFDARCGRTFKAEAFGAEFERFWASLAEYQPRAYVQDELSMAAAAQRYLAAYRTLKPQI